MEERAQGGSIMTFLSMACEDASPTVFFGYRGYVYVVLVWLLLCFASATSGSSCDHVSRLFRLVNRQGSLKPQRSIEMRVQKQKEQASVFRLELRCHFR